MKTTICIDAGASELCPFWGCNNCVELFPRIRFTYDKEHNKARMCPCFKYSGRYLYDRVTEIIKHNEWRLKNG
jgi:hypothetical protein